MNLSRELISNLDSLAKVNRRVSKEILNLVGFPDRIPALLFGSSSQVMQDPFLPFTRRLSNALLQSFRTYDRVAYLMEVIFGDDLQSNASDTNENLIAALDLVFEQRYGWPQGTAAQLSPAQALIALEHACEYDSVSRPSIWKIVSP